MTVERIKPEPIKKIKGQPHLLAYITPNEVEKLKALGGQETMTKEGIPAYPEYDNYGYSSQSDFDAGDRSKSNDPNVRGTAPGQNRVTAAQLAAINAKEKEAARIAKEKLDKRKAKNKNITKFGYNKPKSKLGGILGTIAGMMLGIPGLGLLTGGLGSLGNKLGDTFEDFTGTMRGINPITGKPNTQAEYEAMVADRKTQGRLDDMYAAKSKGKGFSQKNIDMIEAMGFQPSTAQNVLTGRDLKGFTPSRMGLQTIDRPTQTFSFDNSGMTKETDDYTDADFTNEYGYPMTAGLLDNIGVRPTIGMENTGLGFSVPTGDVGLNASGRLGNLSATIDAIDALKGQSVDPQINYSGNFGNTNVYGNYSDDVQNLGLNFNNDRGLYGGVEYDAITGEPRANIGFRRTFEPGGGLSSLFTRR
jgi:hypothetical protein